jgi:hypothetical protein
LVEIGSAPSLQPELTSVLFGETKPSHRQIDLTDFSNGNNKIFLILYYNENCFLNDLKSCFDEVTDIPKSFNVNGKTWIPMDCNVPIIAAEGLRKMERSWKDLRKRVVAIGLYQKGPRDPSPLTWFTRFKEFMVRLDMFKSKPHHVVDGMNLLLLYL